MSEITKEERALHRMDVEDWKATRAERDALQIERLNLRAERDELREALRRIADDPTVRSHPDSVRVAREALAKDAPPCS